MFNNLKRLNQKNANGSDADKYRIKTGLRTDPAFQVNMSQFFGLNPSEDAQY